MIVIEYTDAGNWAMLVGDQRIVLESVDFSNKTTEVPDTEDPEVKHQVVLSSSVTFTVPHHVVEIRKVD